MARYCYSYVFGDECIYYLESTDEEDMLESIDDGIDACFGTGYLEFWKRCRCAQYTLPIGGKSTITDTYTGETKIW